MCNYDAEDPDLSRHSTQKARKEYPCSVECGAPIVRGDVYVKEVTLYDGDWNTFRTHQECHALLSHIATDLCGTHRFGVEPIAEQYREALEEHSHNVSLASLAKAERLRNSVAFMVTNHTPEAEGGL